MSIRKAFTFIICVTLAISGTTACWLFLNYYLTQKRSQDPDYQVRALVQRANGKYNLPTSALIELLGLSIDKPINLYYFDTAKASNSLATLGIFKVVNISKSFPETLVVEYELREPIAYLDDISNTAIDNNFIAFPFFPYYTPKKMPIVRLNKDDLKWNTSVIEDENAELVKRVFTQIESFEIPSEKISWIDVSSMLNNNHPFQEIILGIETQNNKKWLRLKAADLSTHLNRYAKLYPYIQQWEKNREGQPTIIDLRFSDLLLLSQK